jgi:hypothetical protein
LFCAPHNRVAAPQDVKILAYTELSSILTVVSGRRKIMEILRLLTPFDYMLILALAAVFVLSVMEGGHHKH